MAQITTYETGTRTATAEWSLPRIIAAASAGTMVEWYDFYIFGALSTTIAGKFYHTGTPLGDLIAWLAVIFGALSTTIAGKFYHTGTPLGDLIAWLATFAIGFIVRPFGALVFGRMGDLIGRKYTFLITISLMGLCTFAVGCLPTVEVLGASAGVILITLRILQGLALGGEYGGAATYVAEHAPQGRRGLYPGWIQTTATIGLF